MQGQLERLPQGKKKSLLFNAWKKQYVVADRGFLQTFSDAGRTLPLETVELFGGRVEAPDANGVTVHDRRGNAVVLRCAEKKEADARKKGRYLGVGVGMYVEICGLGPSVLLPPKGMVSVNPTPVTPGSARRRCNASPMKVTSDWSSSRAF